MDTSDICELANAITERICWALDIEFADKTKDEQPYSNTAQTIFDITFDELSEELQ